MNYTGPIECGQERVASWLSSSTFQILMEQEIGEQQHHS